MSVSAVPGSSSRRAIDACEASGEERVAVTRSARRTRIRVPRRPAIAVTRVGHGLSEVVYLLVADKRISYPLGRSRIVYIGRTGIGMRQICASAASKSQEVLALHG